MSRSCARWAGWGAMPTHRSKRLFHCPLRTPTTPAAREAEAEDGQGYRRDRVAPDTVRASERAPGAFQQEHDATRRVRVINETQQHPSLTVVTACASVSAAASFCDSGRSTTAARHLAPPGAGRCSTPPPACATRSLEASAPRALHLLAATSVRQRACPTVQSRAARRSHRCLGPAARAQSLVAWSPPPPG